MNYSQVIETLQRLGVEHYGTTTIKTRTEEIPDGVWFYWPSFFLRDKVNELRLALPDYRITFNPNTQKISIEDL